MELLTVLKGGRRARDLYFLFFLFFVFVFYLFKGRGDSMLKILNTFSARQPKRSSTYSICLGGEIQVNAREHI